MSARNYDPVYAYDDNHAGTAMRLAQLPARESKPPMSVPRAWLTEGSRFDQPIPDATERTVTEVEPFAYERVSVEDAQNALKVVSIFDPPHDLPRLRSRRQAPPEPLQDATIRWLSQFPLKLRPLELGRQFPRIANKVCGLWADPALCDQYLSGLLMDSRDGAREGFPMVVAAELAALLSRTDTTTDGRPWEQVKDIR